MERGDRIALTEGKKNDSCLGEFPGVEQGDAFIDRLCGTRRRRGQSGGDGDEGGSKSRCQLMLRRC
ncbi:MAG TPA: hypothetical protein VNO75_04850 [Gemmatimonadaceae bacterium]|nr:hypothetical protein [Gemmatimonadaceae bacterium]